MLESIINWKAIDPKTIVTISFSLFGVVLGWLLGQGATIAKDLWTTNKLRQGLFIELEDVLEQLERVIRIHRRQLSFVAHEGMEPTSALPIQNMFFQQNFKSVFSHLNRSQRISYQLIHLSLDSLNKKNAELEKLFTESYKEFKIEKNAAKILSAAHLWGENVINLYRTAMTIRWHVSHHLKNPNDPTLKEYSYVHQSFLQYLEAVEQEISKILEEAKQTSKEDLEKIFNPESFPITKPA